MKDIKKIENYLRAIPYCYFLENQSVFFKTIGIPDIICCINGKFIAFEIKKDGDSLLHQAAINRINKANGIARIVRDVESVKRIVDSISK